MSYRIVKADKVYLYTLMGKKSFIPDSNLGNGERVFVVEKLVCKTRGILWWKRQELVWEYFDWACNLMLAKELIPSTPEVVYEV